MCVPRRDIPSGFAAAAGRGVSVRKRNLLEMNSTTTEPREMIEESEIIDKQLGMYNLFFISSSLS